jgi:hypothetical protein
MAGLISQFNGQSVEGVQETEGGEFQRVVMTTAMEGTTTLSGKKSVEVLVKDENDNEQLCVATVNFGTVSSASVESVNGKTGVIVLTGEDIDVNTDEGSRTIEDEFVVVNQDLDTLGEGLSTAQNDIDELGDQVSTIEGKIPDSAATTNQLVTASDIANFLDKTSTEEQSIAGNVSIDADLEVMGDTIFSTANPTCGTSAGYSDLDNGALPTKAQVESRIAALLPAYPSEDGTYGIELVVEDGVPTLSWVAKEA